MNTHTKYAVQTKPSIETKCPVKTTLNLISNKWKILIIHSLIDGPKRPSQIRRSINEISQKVLTENLRKLENDRLITRTVFPEIPPHVEYSLTDLGYNLIPILNQMYKWGNNYLTTIEQTDF